MKTDEFLKFWEKDGDDFAVFTNENGGGVIMVKSEDAMKALQAGIAVLRQRKKEKGTYDR